MLTDLPAEELAAVLERAAAKILRQAGVRRPPVDTLQLAAALGIQTAIDRSQQARARYVNLRGAGGGHARPAILLRPEPRTERRHWAVAHEIGEQHAVDVFRRLKVSPREAPPESREWVANQLANRILLPRRWLQRAGAACGWDLCALKELFATASHELILRRMLDLDAPLIVSIYDHGAVTFRRGNFAAQVPPVTSIEADCWRTAHATGEYQSRRGVGQNVRAWPVHEEGWKRELLRLEVENLEQE
jgi:hypothetical protein